MSNKRITMKTLDSLAQTLNLLTGNPLEPCIQRAPGDTGPLKWLVGNHHVGRSATGVELLRVANEGGATNTVNWAPNVPGMYMWLHGAIHGVRLARARDVSFNEATETYLRIVDGADLKELKGARDVLARIADDMGQGRTRRKIASRMRDLLLGVTR